MAAWGISMYSIVLPVLLGIIPGITPGSVLADETSSWGCGILSGLFADEEREYIRSSRRLADIQSRREIDERKCDAAGKTPAETPYERSCTQLGGVPNQEPPPPDP
ncbi:MAG: hypothetical protein HY074_16200, partial [Deltaproteobacteria bacterium]|nr:hypothetical protein [Deltaproteobacteria bacterium]